MKAKFYLSLLLITSALASNAQNPGGVGTDLTLWLKSSTGTSTTTNGTGLAAWIYANDVTKSFTQASAPLQPVYTANGLNFQPLVTFAGANFMDGPTGLLAPLTALDDDYSIFGVWSSAYTGTNPQRIWSQRDAVGGAAQDGASLWLYNGQYGDQPEIGPSFITGLGVNYAVNEFKISQLNLLATAANDLEIIDQSNYNTPFVTSTDAANGAGVRQLTDQLNRLGARTNQTDEPFNGTLAELIIFSGPVSGAQRAQVFSYLAMKYGISFSSSLVNSAGTVVWNATTNATYNNAVFGIGRDDLSGLLVGQSNSVLTGSGNGTGLPGTGNIVLSGAISLDNNDFLQIGHDVAALTEVTTDLPVVAAGMRRLAREWKVQHTGDAGAVNLSFDFNGITTTGTIGNTSNFRVMVDQDGDGDFTTGLIRYYSPSSFTGSVATFPGLRLNNNEVFTILTSSAPITLAVTWKDFNVVLVNKTSAVLRWSVESNEQTISYSVQHSTDGTNFEDVGVVNNNTAVKDYNFTYRGLSSGTHYFRIRELDFAGKQLLSKTVTLALSAPPVVTYLFANPVRTNLAQLVVQSQRFTGKASVEVLTVSGTSLGINTYAIARGENRLDVDVSKLTPGNYILRVVVGESMENIKLVR